MDAVPIFATAYFIAASIFLMAARVVPQLDQFFKHGKLLKSDLNTHVPALQKRLADIMVPKSWFAHFYHIFTALMVALWCVSGTAVHYPSRLVQLLLTLQAVRRSYESIFLTKWSALSRMHFSHYIVGLLFYVFVALIAFAGTEIQGGHLIRTDRVKAVCVSLFVIFSVDQHKNHRHLAGLKKYTAPSAGLFSVLSCAHYFDEVMIYGSVAALSFCLAQWSAQAMAFVSAWVFTVVNLSISARGTQAFYKAKFDDYRVRYAIIPYVY
ncbi:hypothetical protein METBISCDRAFT_17152 [Metschnikowia bicuspidata]|uniref:Polyprenal reductase n=1 Tax=Metschnikowia bicuspidata TaxID=27322 RepID=A0A4P9ZDR7_9ASCO|nr:hypothetical protein METBISCDRAFT_17152 [Metschnikowia bicuspidata]